jgi:hypothetical protein
MTGHTTAHPGPAVADGSSLARQTSSGLFETHEQHGVTLLDLREVREEVEAARVEKVVMDAAERDDVLGVLTVRWTDTRTGYEMSWVHRTLLADAAPTLLSVQLAMRLGPITLHSSPLRMARTRSRSGERVRVSR